MGSLCSGVLLFALSAYDPVFQLLWLEDRVQKIKITVVGREPVLIGKAVFSLYQLEVFVIPQNPEIIPNLSKRPGGIFPDLLSFEDDLLHRYAIPL